MQQINSTCDLQTLNGLLAPTAVHGKWNGPEISFGSEASEKPVTMTYKAVCESAALSSGGFS